MWRGEEVAVRPERRWRWSRSDRRWWWWPAPPMIQIREGWRSGATGSGMPVKRTSSQRRAPIIDARSDPRRTTEVEDDVLLAA
ncbi:Os06g0277700 [Oryza sativa Japonica Group]|uniref:Os06g0277700 protein n=1 Tax=Oryza sativa subsp. japonica TaxID=39947 RepID=Q0DCX4_ORYSJ|nr:Os06g0277700 [Oryza sativa Japonica Group]|eukprot:NP_001057385.1 Os06g0277700 [Oryza sativa Japonica Group]